MGADHPRALLLLLTGKWFVFWAVDVRLTLAGLRQAAAPDFTAREVFGIEGPDALPLVRELGFANLAAGVIGTAAIAWPGFVLPAAIWGAIFLGAAGVMHMRRRGRTAYENVAMVSDLFVALVLAGYAVTMFMLTVTLEADALSLVPGRLGRPKRAKPVLAVQCRKSSGTGGAVARRTTPGDRLVRAAAGRVGSGSSSVSQRAEGDRLRADGGAAGADLDDVALARQDRIRRRARLPTMKCDQSLHLLGSTRAAKAKAPPGRRGGYASAAPGPQGVDPEEAGARSIDRLAGACAGPAIRGAAGKSASAPPYAGYRSLLPQTQERPGDARAPV